MGEFSFFLKQQSIMSKGSGSIQRLLKAESEANAKIASARQNKQNLLKKARDDADLEFQDYKRNYELDTGSNEKRLQEETQKAIDDINRQVSANKQEVVDLILKTISEVHIEESANE